MDIHVPADAPGRTGRTFPDYWPDLHPVGIKQPCPDNPLPPQSFLYPLSGTAGSAGSKGFQGPGQPEHRVLF